MLQSSEFTLRTRHKRKVLDIRVESSDAHLHQIPVATSWRVSYEEGKNGPKTSYSITVVQEKKQ